MKKPSKTFPPELSQPIKWTGKPWPDIGPEPGLGLLRIPKTEKEKSEHRNLYQAAMQDMFKAVAGKLSMLADCYGLDTTKPDLWPWMLAYILASERFSGFQINYGRKTRGRSKIWNNSRYLSLLAAVETLKRENPNRDDAASIRELVRRDTKNGHGPYCAKGKEKEKALHKTLMNRLSEARSPAHNKMAIPLANPRLSQEEKEVWLTAVIDVYGPEKKNRLFREANL